MTSDEIVTRFAPNPIGYLHLRYVRSALLGWSAEWESGCSPFILRVAEQRASAAVLAALSGLSLGLHKRLLSRADRSAIRNGSYPTDGPRNNLVALPTRRELEEFSMPKARGIDYQQRTAVGRAADANRKIPRMRSQLGVQKRRCLPGAYQAIPCPLNSLRPPKVSKTVGIGTIQPYSPDGFAEKRRPTHALPSSATTKLPESPGNAKGVPPSARTVQIFLNQTTPLKCFEL